MEHFGIKAEVLSRSVSPYPHVIRGCYHDNETTGTPGGAERRQVRLYQVYGHLECIVHTYIHVYTV